MRLHRPRCWGFSLIELVIVVVIIGIIAAIAIPRLGRGSAGAAESGFAENLAGMRRAIELYRAEHGTYPTCVAVSGGKTTIMFQLTEYTDEAGNYSATRSATHRYGPYLRVIPPLLVSDRKDRTKINTADGPGVGWIYDPASGEVQANTGTATGESGKLYSDY